jgi:hypothetical protein
MGKQFGRAPLAMATAMASSGASALPTLAVRSGSDTGTA